MSPRPAYDAVIIGSGPNGLAAAVRLAGAGKRVKVFEARSTTGGGTRTAELTRDGYLHDVCAAVHPLALASPFFRELDLYEFGLQWIQPEIPLAHPLDGGSAVVLRRNLPETARELGADRVGYTKLFQPLVDSWQKITADFLGPLPLPPRHPLTAARFAPRALRSAAGLADSRFQGAPARALFAGLSAHSTLPLDRPGTAAFGLILGTLAHAVGWPVARGGSEHIARALSSLLASLQGEIVTGQPISSLDELPPSRAVLFDLAPRGVLEIAGPRLSPSYRRQLEDYRYGPGVCKVDWALEAPIPWQAKTARRAGTLHLGGTLDEIMGAEQQVWDGVHPGRPFVILNQPSLFDPTRAPGGKHIAWAYCHVPHGSRRDVSGAIEDQVERFAPGFKERILARHVRTAADMETYNANYVGGDINGGAPLLGQLFTRPALKLNPYRIPVRGSRQTPELYICSAATPPGGGVHGLCGYHAARTVLADLA